MAKDRTAYHAAQYQKKKAERKKVLKATIQPPQPIVESVANVEVAVENLNQTVERLKETPLIEKDSTEFNVFNLKKYSCVSILVLFICMNTIFLVNEQVRFYVLRGESTFYSLAVSILCEAAVILLSFFYARSRDIWSRLRLGFILTLTVGCILSVICLGVDRNQSVEQKNAEISSLMRSQIETLKKIVLDKPKFAPKLSRTEEDLRLFLQTHNSSDSILETFVLVSLRMISLSWNVIFASLIAFILSEKYAR
jgi:hypothetical protein